MLPRFLPLSGRTPLNPRALGQRGLHGIKLGPGLNVSIGSIALLAISRDPHDRNRLVRLN